MIIPTTFLRERAEDWYTNSVSEICEPIKNQGKMLAHFLCSQYADEDDIAYDYLDYVCKTESAYINNVMRTGADCDMPLRVMLKFAKEKLDKDSYNDIKRDYKAVLDYTWHTPDQVELYGNNTCSETVMDQDGNKVYYDSETDEWIFDGPGIRTCMYVKKWRELNAWEK